MTWPELHRALPEIELALLPIGAAEDPGHGGTFSMRTETAEGFVRALARRMYPRALALPAFPYSYANGAGPGVPRIGLRAQTLTRVLQETALSLRRHGLRKLLFVAGTRSAEPVLNLVIANLKAQAPDLLTGWVTPDAMVGDLKVQLFGRGGDQAELAEALFLAPQSIRLAAAVHAGGGNGSPVSLESGRYLTEHALQRLESFLNTHF